jgi:hypothetical protein
VTHPALALLIGPEFDEFLRAPICADRDGTGLSVLSALARLNVDPWQEATSLARMPREAAVVRLTALIDAPPNGGTIGIPTTIAADLVAPLPRGNRLNVRSSVSVFAPAGRRQARTLMALSALAIMTLIVFAMSAAIPGVPGIGENPLPPRANLACHRRGLGC